jgi:hypothetical protein
MSPKLKREIKRRYIEYVVLYIVFSWPICYLTKPHYMYQEQVNVYMGGTKYCDNPYTAFIMQSGSIIALTRLRDRLLL